MHPMSLNINLERSTTPSLTLLSDLAGDEHPGRFCRMFLGAINNIKLHQLKITLKIIVRSLMGTWMVVVTSVTYSKFYFLQQY